MAASGLAFAETLSTMSDDAAPNAGLPGESMLQILGTEAVGQLTGGESANDTGRRWDVHGTDLGHMFWHRDQLYMVFGDTFGAREAGRRRNWRSNVMARIADPDPESGFPFEAMITGPQGAAREVIPSRKVNGEEMTVIPTYGISIDERMYLHYMSVERWGDRGGEWAVGHSGFAYSDDDGLTWEKPADAVWPRGMGFEQVAFAHEDDLLYTFGIPEGRFGGVRLRRSAPADILAGRAYEYWGGDAWTADPAAAATIVPAPVGEFSVAWSEAHERWLMVYLDEERHAIMLRSAPALTGPWGEAQTVATAEAYPGLYAPYIVPGREIDTDLYYTMSQWGPYNVFLMHTTLGPATPTVASAEEAVAEENAEPGASEAH